VRRGLLVASLLIGFCGIAVSSWGQEPVWLTAEGEGAGRAAARFYGSEVMIDFAAELVVRGTLWLEGEPLAFEAMGTVQGGGHGSSATLDATIWSTVVAEGTLETGEPVTLRGGISIEIRDADLSSAAAGAGSGDFYLVVDARGTALHVAGTVHGDASGGLVPPPADDPYATVFSGTYSFRFDDAAVVDPAASDPEAAPWGHLPWKISDWPEDLSEQLLQLLEPPPAPEEAETGIEL